MPRPRGPPADLRGDADDDLNGDQRNDDLLEALALLLGQDLQQELDVALYTFQQGER
jgi:hypothetical protein